MGSPRDNVEFRVPPSSEWILWNTPLPWWRRIVSWREWAWLDDVLYDREFLELPTNMAPVVAILAVLAMANWSVGGPWMTVLFGLLWVRYRAVAIAVNGLLLVIWLLS